MSFTTKQKFDVLCKITRASHFEWREAFIKMFPDVNPMDAVMNIGKLSAGIRRRHY